MKEPIIPEYQSHHIYDDMALTICVCSHNCMTYSIHDQWSYGELYRSITFDSDQVMMASVLPIFSKTIQIDSCTCPETVAKLSQTCPYVENDRALKTMQGSRMDITRMLDLGFGFLVEKLYIYIQPAGNAWKPPIWFKKTPNLVLTKFVFNRIRGLQGYKYDNFIVMGFQKQDHTNTMWVLKHISASRPFHPNA